jgi:GT2 family glycosyltransferase
MAENIAIVVPTYNRKDITLRFIRRIREQSPEIPIYVCDSGSTDGTVEALSSFSVLEILHVGSAAWWSAAVNRGIERALSQGFSAILIMNDDIEFDDRLILSLLEKHHQFPDAIVSPLQGSHSGLFLGMQYFGMFKRMKILCGAESEIAVDTTNGCCLLVPESVFAKVGKIDEEHCPHLYGDTEFQVRAGKLSFPTIACPSIYIAQLGQTDYYSKLKLGTMLTFSGSPLHLGAYFQFGRTLFGGNIPFMILGIKYHYGYVKAFVKALIHIAMRRKISGVS